MTDEPTMSGRLRRWARADVWGGRGNAGTFLEEVADALDDKDAEIKRLREALDDCEGELNAYYNVEYGGDHPYSRKQLANAIKYNPATLALKGGKGE